MQGSDPESEGRVPVGIPKPRRNSKSARSNQTKRKRPARTDILVEAFRLRDEGAEDKPLTLLTVGTKGPERFFPGTKGKTLDLLEIVTEVLQTYQDGGGDTHADLAEIMSFLKVPALVPKKSKRFLPLRGKNIFYEDRAHLTAAALLLLLSWVQRKRHQVLSILMDFRSEGDREGTKMKRLQQALEEFLIGTESLRDNSKKSGGREL